MLHHLKYIPTKSNFVLIRGLKQARISVHTLAQYYIDNRQKIGVSALNNLLCNNSIIKDKPISQEELETLLTISPVILLVKDIFYKNVVNYKKLVKIAGYTTSKSKNAGIYIWTNLVTKEQYVGSSTDLSSRVRKYFHKTANSKRVINKNILLYGMENFTLSIVILPSCYSLGELKRLVIVLEQYYILKCNPALNIVKIAGGMWNIPPVITAKHREAQRDRISLTLYVYFENVIIFAAKSRDFLSKITGVSPATLTQYSSGKTGELYGKFVISRQLPPNNALFHLKDEKELKTMFENAREVNPNKTFLQGVITTVTDILDDNKTYTFDSYAKAAKFTSTHANRAVTPSTLRSILLKRKIHKGWLFSNSTPFF